MKTLTLLLLVFCNSAFADILFVDFNFSSKEVETATKAAVARGEKLIVYPNVSASDRKILIEKKDKLQALEAKLSKLNTKAFDPKLSPKKKSELVKELDKMSVEANNLYNEIKGTTHKYSFSTDELKDLIKKHNNAKDGFSSLIISGHHVGSQFFGDIGSLVHKDIKNIISEFPKAFSSMHSVYLWGCYTANKKGVIEWKKMIPSAYVVAGWDGSAPKEDKKINHDYLYKMLMKEKELSEQTSLKNAVSLFKSIPSIGETNAAFCVGNAYVTNKSKELFDKYSMCPEAELSHLERINQEVFKFFNAEEKGYEDVPKDTQNSVLREAYSLGRRMEHCDDKRNLGSDSLNNLIMLIFNHQVTSNFGLVYKNELADARKILTNLKAPKETIFPDFNDKNITRQSILKTNEALQAFIRSQKKLSSSNRGALNKVATLVDNIVKKHNCVSPLWVEPVSVERLRSSVNSYCAQMGNPDYDHNRIRGNFFGFDRLWD